MEIIYMLVTLIGISTFVFFVWYGFKDLPKIFQYANDQGIDIFGHKHISYLLAMSDITFMTKLWSAEKQEFSGDDKLEGMIKSASKKYRLSIYVSGLIILLFFTLAVLK